MFTLAHPYRRTIEEKIERKIKEKYDQLFYSDNPSVLYLYSQILDNTELYSLFEKKVDNMEVILPSYTKLMGLVLTVPHLRFDVISGMTSSIRMDHKDEKIYFDSEIGKGQYESSLIWKNLHSDQVFPTKIEDALKKYTSNVKNSLEIS